MSFSVSTLSPSPSTTPSKPSAGSKSSKALTPIPSLNFIDMRDNYNFELLERFYKELMIPNFPMKDGSFFSSIFFFAPFLHFLFVFLFTPFSLYSKLLLLANQNKILCYYF